MKRSGAAPWAPLAGLFLAAALAGGCGPDGPRIDVSVTGLIAAVQTLEVHTTLDGRPAREGPGLVVRSLDHFSLQLPPGSAGTLKISVGGDPGDGCYVVSGSAELGVGGDPSYEAMVQLTPPLEASCQLVVELWGPGVGQVTADSGTLVGDNGEMGCQTPLAPQSLPYRCRARYPRGTEVSLSGTGLSSWYFGNWAGACSGRTQCKVAITDEPAVVKANIITAPVCVGSFCWEYPLPYSNELRGIWAASADQAWAAGLEGVILHWDGTSWYQIASGSTNSIFGIYGFAADDIWTVGALGNTTHWNGSTWAPMLPKTAESLFGVWGSASNDIWTVGYHGAILHWDGTVWNPVPSGTQSALRSVWGSGPRDVWSVGWEGAIVHWDGAAWKAPDLPFNLSIDLNGVWGSGPADVWVVGDGGLVLHWDGLAWAVIRSGTTKDLNSVWGSGPGDVWAAGFDSVLVRWTGKSWQQIDVADWGAFMGIGGSGPSAIWAVGRLGTIKRWDGSTWTWQLGGNNDKASALAGGLALWGSGVNDVWAVFSYGLLHWDGLSWALFDTGTQAMPISVWGSGPTEVWVLTVDGEVRQWNGMSWHVLFATSGLRRFVTGSGPRDVWVSGDDVSFHWDGVGLQRLFVSFHQIYSFGPSNAWGILPDGTLQHWDGSHWTPVESGTSPCMMTARCLLTVWGREPNDVWATGEHGTLIHWDGSRWRPVSSGTTASLKSIWGTGPDDVWVAGTGGIEDQSKTLFRGYGDSFHSVPSPGDGISALWGASPNDVWGLSGGSIMRYRP